MISLYLFGIGFVSGVFVTIVVAYGLALFLGDEDV